jgi:hypothetical protein
MAVAQKTDDTLGFLSNCKNWSSTYEGYLQALERSKDSLGPFFFYESYNTGASFELIFVPKEKGKNWDDYQNGCANQYRDFDIYSFVYPLRDPDKQKDVHQINIDFPVSVRLFRRDSADLWQYKGVRTARSLSELTELEFILTRFTLHKCLSI